MPDYASLSTQIDAVKSEITASLNASTYTAQDLVFISSALDKLGTMLGVADIVAATAAKITELNNATNAHLSTLETTKNTYVDTINSTFLHPLFLIGV
jgi:hypothetical protein